MENGEKRVISTRGADARPSTSNKPSGEIKITLIEYEPEKWKLLENADPDEIEKWNLLNDANLVPSTLNKPLIQTVPRNLRSCYSENDCDRYFKPTSVAIGPLHHKRKTDKNSRMGRGEQRKLKLAAMFIKESQSTKETFLVNVKNIIESLKSCYNLEGLENWTDDELALMLLVDGCALLHFIVRDVYYDWERFSVSNGLVSIEKMDFFLLENQLPYQLLEILIALFAKALPDQSAQNSCKESLKQCITEFINGSFLRLTAQQEHQIQFDNSQPQPQLPQPKSPPQSHPQPPHHLLRLLQRGLQFINRLKRTAQQKHQNQPDYSHHLLDLLGRKLIHQNQPDQPDHPHHLLDLLRRKLIEKKGGKREGINKDGYLEILTGDKSEQLPLIGNVRELRDKGIHFKAKEKGSAITNNDFKDSFCMATLTLAPIFLHNTTVTLLLNLIAYELCPGFEEHWKITSHLSLLDSLIDNAEDAKGLKDAGVLHNGLGSDEAVAELLNKISGILVPNFKEDPDLRSDIHAYCKKPYLYGLVARLEAKLRHTYFRRPWSIFIFLGALAGLIMTGLQTYKSFHGNN